MNHLIISISSHTTGYLYPSNPSKINYYYWAKKKWEIIIIKSYIYVGDTRGDFAGWTHCWTAPAHCYWQLPCPQCCRDLLHLQVRILPRIFSMPTLRSPMRMLHPVQLLRTLHQYYFRKHQDLLSTIGLQRITSTVHLLLRPYALLLALHQCFLLLQMFWREIPFSNPNWYELFQYCLPGSLLNM